MKILVNAFSVAYGGGLVRTLNIINTFKKYPGIDFLILAPDIEYYRALISPNVKITFIQGLFLKRIFRIYTDIFLIRREIRKYNPNLILSLGNLPAITKQYQVFIHDNPLASVKYFRKYGYTGITDIIINSLRNMVFTKRLKYIDHLIVQTKVQLNKLQEIYKSRITKIPVKSIIAPSIPVIQINSGVQGSYFADLKNNTINLLCLSRYYPHKNIEILLDVARIFRQNKSPFKIILTISQKHGKGAATILKKINKENLTGYITNIGEISPYSLTDIMKYADALILPSLLESYSLIYLEAMFFHKPVFTSDLDFAYEACKNGAFYFNPLDADNIYSTIISAFGNSTELKKKINYEKDIMKESGSWVSIIKTILNNSQAT